MKWIRIQNLSVTFAIMGIENFSFLMKKLPGFKVHGSQVRIIHEPSQFYQVTPSHDSLSQADIFTPGAGVEGGGGWGQGGDVRPLLGCGGQGAEAEGHRGGLSGLQARPPGPDPPGLVSRHSECRGRVLCQPPEAASWQHPWHGGRKVILSHDWSESRNVTWILNCDWLIIFSNTQVPADILSDSTDARLAPEAAAP